MIHEQTQKQENIKIIKKRIEKFQMKNRIDTISTNDFVQALTIAYDKYLDWINEDNAILKRHSGSCIWSLIYSNVTADIDDNLRDNGTIIARF